MNVKLDSVLLLSLVVPFIMSVSLSPRETPYWLFGLIFLGLLFYIIVDFLKLSRVIYEKIKRILLLSLIIGVIGSAFASAIIVRHQTYPTHQIHDMPLQQEIAIRFLLEGKNPYSTTYFGTFLEEWHYSDTEKNPALYHFVLMPVYILFAIPFYFVSNVMLGFFDARMPLLFLFFSLLFLASKFSIDEDKKRLFLILLAFNPATLPFMLEGRSDIFMYAFLFMGFYLLHKKRYGLGGIPMAVAFVVKQSAWPILPLYAAFMYLKTRSVQKTVMYFLPFMATLALFVGPFALWNTKAFYDSTVGYLSGGIATSYPISGYGLGKLLNQAGIIKDVHSYFPFQILQILFGIPILIVLFHFLRRRTNVQRLILAYGILLFVFWYLSRYFNNSHLGYLSMIFITAYFWPKDKSE